MTVTVTTTTDNIGKYRTTVSCEFARPADTTAYTANDVIADATSGATVLSFTRIARVGQGSGDIIKVRLLTDQKTNTAQYRLHIYNVSPTTINDNVPYTLLWADRASRIGYLDINNVGTEDSSTSTAASGLNISDILSFICASSDQNLYGILETKTAFTPASGQNYFIELTVDLK